MYTPSAPYADRQSSATVLEPSSDNAEAKIAGHWRAVVLILHVKYYSYRLICQQEFCWRLPGSNYCLFIRNPNHCMQIYFLISCHKRRIHSCIYYQNSLSAHWAYPRTARWCGDESSSEEYCSQKCQHAGTRIWGLCGTWNFSPQWDVKHCVVESYSHVRILCFLTGAFNICCNESTIRLSTQNHI